ncbi:phospholipase D/nuclease [Hypoxylon sp. FL1857]|nr:phospholipase D/nuclease [Hypoxylon sp. FL1857]
MGSRGSPNDGSAYIRFDSFPSFKETWKASLTERAPASHDEFPDYHVSDPEASLVSSSDVRSFHLGTGASIYTQSLIPAIIGAKYEVILVTCFWAPSPTLSALRDALEKLAENRRERIRASGLNADALPPLRIRICFSSRSFFQKLFHTWSKDGYVYPPSTWSKRLGLPNPEVLEAGRIDLRVKSLFFLPFSVMHPKFLIVDRETAFLPSCNVSWEVWLEGCVEITGDAVAGLVEFYRQVWDKQLEDQLPARAGLDNRSTRPPSLGELGLTSVTSPTNLHDTILSNSATPTVLLPSSHHQNPRFDLVPWHDDPSPPPTPLNCAILQLLDMAKHFIYMQTPNLTSTAVIDKLLEALKRGVNVAIVTSKRLMLLEQLVTAGTTTSLCLRSLIRKYKKLESEKSQFRSGRGRGPSEQDIDIEAQRPRLGFLTIDYFRPDPAREADCLDDETAEEPVQSHLKLTLVDGQYVVLGSGNMDRASWFTSQELGIMFHSKDIATAVGTAVGNVLSGRREPFFSSSVADDELGREFSREDTTNQNHRDSNMTRTRRVPAL